METAFQAKAFQFGAFQIEYHAHGLGAQRAKIRGQRRWYILEGKRLFLTIDELERLLHAEQRKLDKAIAIPEPKTRTISKKTIKVIEESLKSLDIPMVPIDEVDDDDDISELLLLL